MILFISILPIKVNLSVDSSQIIPTFGLEPLSINNPAAVTPWPVFANKNILSTIF